MHDLLQQMGQEIVVEESKKPETRRNLWKYEDIRDVLTINSGTENIEGILLNMFEKNDLVISSKAFKNMRNLRFLKICYYLPSEKEDFIHYPSHGGQVLLPRGLKCLTEKLRYLKWEKYPSTSLPQNFCPKNLVELRLSDSNLTELWDGDKKGIKCRVDLVEESGRRRNHDFVFHSVD
ncbi:disease resistance protein RPS6-like isoform X1 [Hevea brasiliensis]|uniref:disease resistance protein RPS6-like isoform X1 n=1 Tax=Hevea brasiliensis TaxID=3981 RepID=UPI000B7887FC|nr:disease resistance protein RPS6-like isoform X1 [Hevea brasiliensis]